MGRQMWKLPQKRSVLRMTVSPEMTPRRSARGPTIAAVNQYLNDEIMITTIHSAHFYLNYEKNEIKRDAIIF